MLFCVFSSEELCIILGEKSYYSREHVLFGTFGGYPSLVELTAMLSTGYLADLKISEIMKLLKLNLMIVPKRKC